MRTERDDIWTIYHAPFNLFPSLEHHSHPYFIILNAYLKFQVIEDINMLPEHKYLRYLVNSIHDLWVKYGSGTGAPETISEGGEADDQGFGGDNDGTDDGDGGGDGGGNSREGSGRDEVGTHSEQHGMDGGGARDFSMAVNTSCTESGRIAYGSEPCQSMHARFENHPRAPRRSQGSLSLASPSTPAIRPL